MYSIPRLTTLNQASLNNTIYIFCSQTFQKNGLSPGSYTVSYNLKKDIEREKRQGKSILPEQKLRRLKLKEERSTSKGACEASEGASYESGMYNRVRPILR